MIDIMLKFIHRETSQQRQSPSKKPFEFEENLEWPAGNGGEGPEKTA